MQEPIKPRFWELSKFPKYYKDLEEYKKHLLNKNLNTEEFKKAFGLISDNYENIIQYLNSLNTSRD